MRMGRIEKLFVNSASHTQQVARHAEAMLKFTSFHSGQRYLDFGCGNGSAAVYVASNYQLEVTGIDIDPEQIRTARAKCRDALNILFLAVDGMRLPFADKTFDIVATNKVTHHIASWKDAFAQMLRVLRPGGYFVYADLVFPTWLASLGPRLVGTAMGFPTAQELDLLAEQSNLTPVHLSKGRMHYEAVWRKRVV